MKRRSQRSRTNSVRVVDVAKRACCSTATVSRVLNTPEVVSAGTRERVHSAIRELGFVPNSAARALRSRRSRMIGVVIPTLNYAIYAAFVEAVQSRLAEFGWSLLVATYELDMEREAEQASLLIERGAEGLILVGARHRDALLRIVEASHTPYVYTHIYDAESPDPCIGIDNRQAMIDIVEYLHGLGHRRFGLISGETQDNDRATTRIVGVRAGLADRGIDLTSSAIVVRRYSVNGGREGLKVLMGSSPRPTAVICGNDVLAFGALIECRELGLTVPDDLSIIGFDDLEFTAQIEPALTSVAYPSDEMGARAATFVLAVLNGEEPHTKALIPTYLKPRGTTGPAPG